VQNPAAPAARTTGDGDATSRVLAGLAALYALLAAVQLVALTGTARLLLVAAATVSGTILAAGALWLRRRRRHGRAAPDWIEAFAVVPLAACLLRVGVTGELEQTVALMLALVAIGGLVRSTRVAAALAAAGCVGWAGVVAAVPALHGPRLGEHAAMVAVAAGLGALLHVAVARREGHLRAARDELATAAQRFRRLFEDSPVGIGVADADGHLLDVNPAFCRLVDRPADALVGASDLDYTHPDDRRQHAGTGRLIEQAADGVAEVEKRYLRPDASIRWAWLSLTHIEPARGSSGPWTLAHAQDVTARHDAEQALRDSERNLLAVTDLARRVRRGEDARTTIVAALHALAGAGTVAITEPVGDPVEALVVTAAHGADVVGTRVPLASTSMTSTVYRTGRGAFLADPATDPLVSPALLALSGARSMMWQPILTGDAVTAVLTVTWNEPLASSDDRRARAVALLADETALALDHERLLARLQQIADTDQLTGLPNRRAWDSRLPDVMATALRHGRPLTVAVADLDRFKEYNDRNGHLEGDRLLRSAAQGFGRALRQGDLVCRWGGEEFAIALQDCGPGDAARVLERVRQAVPDGQTCSIGYASWDGLESPADLLARADAALYDAKHAGRDRVTPAGAAALGQGQVDQEQKAARASTSAEA
jgi:diguanylate cyclase (GGDEF)-like protein/PAS domain S-box-containing protein